MDEMHERVARVGRDVVNATPRWRRGRAKYDRSGWISLDKNSQDYYYPVAEPNLALDFARVYEPSHAVDFAEKYGLLWHGPDAASRGEKPEEQFTSWLKEAEDVRLIFDLYSLLRDAISDDPEALGLLRRLDISGSSKEKLREMKDEELLEYVSLFIGQQIARGMNEVKLTLRAAVDLIHSDGRFGLPGVFGYMVFAPNLISHIYCQIAIYVVRSVPLGTCRECGSYFEVVDPRQEFCSRNCGSRNRNKRHRAQRKQVQAGAVAKGE